MQRRTFLTAASLTLGQFLLACGQNPDATPQIRLLKDSIPAQVLKEFQRSHKTSPEINFLQSDQIADLFKLLETWKTPAPARSFLPFGNAAAPLADLVTLGDFWLTAAIQQGLIRPVDLAVPWQQLAPEWLALVKRDRQGLPSPEGQIWGVPYRWGSLMIAYRPDKFKKLGWQPNNWSDLWRPELKGHVSLLDSPRSVIGLTLQKLGQSPNLQDLNGVTNLATELKALHQQVKFYSSEAYLQPLTLGDTWAAVGWSNEILPALERDRELAAAVPATGTLITADLWVHPASAQLNATQAAQLLEWITFCWEPQIATQISLLSFVASPRFWGGQLAIPPSLQQKTLLLPSPDLLQRSAFLQPLTAAASDQYHRQWSAMRQ